MLSSSFKLLLPLAFSAVAIAQSSEASEVEALRVAPAAVDRLKILNQDSDFVFNFLTSTTGVVTGAAGHLVSATVSNFPAVVGNGIAMTVGFLGPCGMNTPHTHPRASEMLFVVNGSISSGMIPENGGAFIFNDVPAGSAMFFPQGSIHFQQNEGCEPITFVSALNDEDPGVNSIAQRYFGLPPDVVSATLGDIGVQEVAGIEALIPDNVAFGTDECLQRCGITRPKQPTNEREPRVSANALPSGFSGPAPPAAPTSTSASAATSTHSTRGIMETAAQLIGAVADPTSSSSSSGTQPVTIALIVIVALLALGYVVMGVAFYMRRRRSQALKERTFIRPDMSGRARVPLAEKDAEASEQASYSTPYDSHES